MKPLFRNIPIRRMAQRMLALARGVAAQPIDGIPPAAGPSACRTHIVTLSAAVAAADKEIQELIADSRATAAAGPRTIETLKAALHDIHGAARQLDNMAGKVTTASAALTAQAQQLQKAVALFRLTSHQKQEQPTPGGV
jgi:hypothetical protein